MASDSEEDFGDESDSEVVAPVAPRSTARPARARTAKTYVVDDSDDSEDDVSEETTRTMMRATFPNLNKLRTLLRRARASKRGVATKRQTL